MKLSLTELGGWKRMGVALAVSIVFHLALFVLALVLTTVAPVVIAKKGEPLFIELPTPEEERAPLGNPALPRGPVAPPAPRPAPKSPPPAPRVEPPRPAPVPQKPAPVVEAQRPAPAPEPPPEPSRAPEPAEPVPAPAPSVVAKAVPPAEPETPKPSPAPPKAEVKAEPTPPSVAPKPEARSEAPLPPAREPRMNLAKPHVELPPSLQRDRPGGGGGLLGGRGGIEGEPVPLDTTNPRYSDYFERIRRQIKEKWIYPREAGEKGIGGQLVIEFAIKKDGWLQFVDLKRSSGVSVLDQYALNAVKLAQPFPQIPDGVSRGSIGIAGIFTYQIVDSSRLLNEFLR